MAQDSGPYIIALNPTPCMLEIMIFCPKKPILQKNNKDLHTTDCV